MNCSSVQFCHFVQAFKTTAQRNISNSRPEVQTASHEVSK